MRLKIIIFTVFCLCLISVGFLLNTENHNKEELLSYAYEPLAFDYSPTSDLYLVLGKKDEGKDEKDEKKDEEEPVQEEIPVIEVELLDPDLETDEKKLILPENQIPLLVEEPRELILPEVQFPLLVEEPRELIIPEVQFPLLLEDKPESSSKKGKFKVLTDLIVNTTDDSDDGVCDVYHCSLREAIEMANNASRNKIESISFSLKYMEEREIVLDSALPPILASNLTLGNELKSCLTSVTINGQNLPDDESILSVMGSSNTIRGLNLINAPHAAIIFVGKNAKGNNVLGNIIGIGANGLSGSKYANKFGIVIEGGTKNTIGGENPNIIGGSSQAGILIFGNRTSNNIVNKNIIGLGKNTGFVFPNKIGIVIDDSNKNTVTHNIISGNENGILVSGDNATKNVVKNNLFNFPKLGIELLNENISYEDVKLFSTNKNADLFVFDEESDNDFGSSAFGDFNFYMNPKKIKNVRNKIDLRELARWKEKLLDLVSNMPACIQNKEEEIEENLIVSVPLFDFPLAYSKSTPQYSEAGMSDFVEIYDSRRDPSEIIINTTISPFIRVDSGEIYELQEAYVYVSEVEAPTKILNEITVNEGWQQFIFEEGSDISDPLTLITRVPSDDEAPLVLKFKLGFKVLLPPFIKPGSYNYNIDVQVIP